MRWEQRKITSLFLSELTVANTRSSWQSSALSFCFLLPEQAARVASDRILATKVTWMTFTLRKACGVTSESTFSVTNHWVRGDFCATSDSGKTIPRRRKTAGYRKPPSHRCPGESQSRGERRSAVRGPTHVPVNTRCCRQVRVIRGALSINLKNINEIGWNAV